MRRQRGIIWPITRNRTNRAIASLQEIDVEITILQADEMTEDSRDHFREALNHVLKAQTELQKALKIN